MSTPRTPCVSIAIASSVSFALALACASKQPTAARADDDAARARTVMVSEPRLIGEPASSIWTELAPDPMFSCVQDRDCTVVEMGCCDRCNGGWQLAVSRDLEDEATATWHDRMCSEAACTTFACRMELTPICDGGVCARREGRADPNGAFEIAIVRNRLPPR
jgi:hypothetical protein